MLAKVLPFVAMLAALAVTPLSLRAFDNLMDASGSNQSYLPLIVELPQRHLAAGCQSVVR